MDFADVVDELATRLSTVTGLRVSPFEPGSVSGDTAIFGYPEEIQYDAAYGRAADRMTLPLVVVAPNPTDRTTRDRLAAYTAGSGTESVKQALETGTGTAFDSVRVASVSFDSVRIGAIDYAGALFTVDIVGSGD